MRCLHLLALASLLAPTTVAQGESQSVESPLIPAGSINSVFGHPHLLILAQDDPAVIKHATWVRDKFFKDKAKLVIGAAALETDLTGHNLLVYGTVDGHPWLARHAERLPFRYAKGQVEIGGTHQGDRLRVICTIRNPQDRQRRAILYTANRVQDIAGINGVFHGPTEYVVANGNSVLASANFAISSHLAVAALQSDLAFLVDKVMTVHPATVEGAAPELQQAIDKAEAAITEPMPRDQFWVHCNQIMLAMHDAHTCLQSPQAGETLDLPFDWLSDGLVVTRDTKELQQGDRILSLAGRDQQQLLQGLRTMVPAENDHWLRARGCQQLRDLATLRALSIADDLPVPIQIEREGKLLTVQIGKGNTPAGPARRPDWVRWTLRKDDDLAVFTLDRCVFDDHYKRRLRAFFRQVAANGIGRIAVDLRSNSGGNSKVCDEFLRYVQVNSYRSYSAAVRETTHSCEQRGYTRDLGFRRYGPQTVDNDIVTDIEPFAGELFALTSKRTFSGGSWFAAVLRDNDLGTIVGEPTGGSPSSYGDILTFTLPHSSTNFTISFKNWLRPDPERDPANTLVPDHVIATTRAHVLAETDPVIEFLAARKSR